MPTARADAFVSRRTGAIVVGASLFVKRIKGIKRAALATVIPSQNGCYMLLDMGANTECRPEMLVQFGIMGSAYMEHVMGVKNPRVGLINIGCGGDKRHGIAGAGASAVSKRARSISSGTSSRATFRLHAATWRWLTALQATSSSS